MKILIVADDNEIIGTIENIEEYNLDKPFARTSVLGDIQAIIEAEKELK